MVSNTPYIGAVAQVHAAAPVAAAPQPPELQPIKAASAGQLKASPRVEIWDMSSGIEQAVVGAQLLGSADQTLKLAYENAVKADEFIRTKLGRNGWDNQGAPIRIVVHAPNEDGTPNMNNAYWDNNSKRVYLGDGDGELFDP
ncbi:MAG: hypothetical protein ABI200_04640, partial [Gaiellales bacterium]